MFCAPVSLWYDISDIPREVTTNIIRQQISRAVLAMHIFNGDKLL